MAQCYHIAPWPRSYNPALILDYPVILHSFYFIYHMEIDISHKCGLVKIVEFNEIRFSTFWQRRQSVPHRLALARLLKVFDFPFSVTRGQFQRLLGTAYVWVSDAGQMAKRAAHDQPMLVMSGSEYKVKYNKQTVVGRIISSSSYDPLNLLLTCIFFRNFESTPPDFQNNSIFFSMQLKGA